jgi:hypothetical protein
VIAGPAWTLINGNATARLTPAGQLDSSYGSGGIYQVPDLYGANGLLLDAGGKFLLPATGPSIQRLNPDGSPDQSFGANGIAATPYGWQGAANGAAVQDDGKIVLAGATWINGQTQILVERLR